MENQQQTEPPAAAPLQQDLLDLSELATLLVRHFKHTEGQWQLSVEFQYAIGNFGPTEDQALPGALMGVKRVGLRKVEHPGPLTVDAAAVNPSGGSGIRDL